MKGGPMIGLILEKRKGGGEKEDSSPDLDLAAEELISAVESKDAKKVATALKAAFYACEDEGDDE